MPTAFSPSVTLQAQAAPHSERASREKNLTEWQYGLASVASPLERFGNLYAGASPLVSVDENGTEREFLRDFFDDEYKALSMVFSQGLLSASSTAARPKAARRLSTFSFIVKGCFSGVGYTLISEAILSVLKNIDFNRLDDAAADYLKKAQADFGTPLSAFPT